MCEPWKPRNSPPARNGFAGVIGSAEPLAHRRRPMSTSLLWNLWMFELPGVLGGGMSGRSVQRKTGTTRGSPRRSRTAKAPRISRSAAKSRGALEWGGWGRLSDDGLGQHNPNRSEGPWSRATHVARMAVLHRAGDLRLWAEDPCCHGAHEGRWQT
jgi:hypothetical protein